MLSSASFSGKSSQNMKISQEQESNTEMNRKVPSRGSSPTREPSVQFDADIPGFEYELEENFVPAETTAESPGMPRFEDFRHPNVKLFVVVFSFFPFFRIIFFFEAMALLCNSFIFVQGFHHLSHQYSSVLCLYFDLEGCFPIDYPPLGHVIRTSYSIETVLFRFSSFCSDS